MLGFIFGTVCLIGLIKVLRHGRSRLGWQGGPWRHGGGGARGFGRGWLLRSMFERLDTTPGQEKAILGALDELRENRRVVHEELRKSRTDFARAVSGGFVDDSALDETFARHDRLLAQLRVSLVEAVKKVHEALDDRQRKAVGDMIESGAGGFVRGPYRAWV